MVPADSSGLALDRDTIYPDARDQSALGLDASLGSAAQHDLAPVVGNLPNRGLLAVALLVAIGILTLYPEFKPLWGIWTNDPLRSLGILLPPISLLLTLHVWGQQSWQLRGTWWGFLPLAASVALSLLHADTVAIFHAGSIFGVSLIPLGLSFFLYGTGVVLFFAGYRVWLKALFPLALLLLVNPLPTTAVLMIDMPLQRISAHIARDFATLIHFAPSNTQLRLMFSPDFGMFIAPGCDGIRGAVSMGYLALILGYWKKFSPLRWAATTLGAVLLGYLFNLIRLCALVLYYRAALGHSWFEDVAKQADYVIGICLFAIAATLFTTLFAHKPELDEKIPTPTPPADQSNSPQPIARQSSILRPIAAKLAAFAILVLGTLTVYGVQRAVQPHASSATLANHQFPQRFGTYQLNRTWKDQANQYGAYVSDKSGREVLIAVWIAAGFHNAQDCQLIRGLDPKSRVVQNFATMGGPVSLDAAFYNDGVSNILLATAGCSPSGCSEQTETGSHTWLSLAPPNLGSLGGEKNRSIPMLVRVEQPNGEAGGSQQLQADLKDFLSQVNFRELSKNFQ